MKQPHHIRLLFPTSTTDATSLSGADVQPYPLVEGNHPLEMVRANLLDVQPHAQGERKLGCRQSGPAK